jgi:hypothetical protein
MAYKLIESIDNYQVEVLTSLAIVMVGSTLAHYTRVSGPLAIVAVGLITRNQSKSRGMSDVTAESVEKFRDLIDEIVNTLLFVLIGLELLGDTYQPKNTFYGCYHIVYNANHEIGFNLHNFNSVVIERKNQSKNDTHFDLGRFKGRDIYCSFN